MDINKFYSLVQAPGLLNHDTLEELKVLTEAHPYFHAAWFLYLRNIKAVDGSGFDEALKKAAPLLPDRKQLYRFLQYSFQNQAGLPIQENAFKTNPYYSFEEEEPTVAGNSLIDKFLATSAGILKLNKPVTDNPSLVDVNELVAKSIAEQDELVSETLANIYLEQKKYDKALEAFRKLSLKYPEKNSYFASRIEDIEKRKNS